MRSELEWVEVTPIDVDLRVVEAKAGATSMAGSFLHCKLPLPGFAGRRIGAMRIGDREIWTEGWEDTVIPSDDHAIVINGIWLVQHFNGPPRVHVGLA